MKKMDIIRANKKKFNERFIESNPKLKRAIIFKDQSPNFFAFHFAYYAKTYPIYKDCTPIGHINALKNYTTPIDGYSPFSSIILGETSLPEKYHLMAYLFIMGRSPNDEDHKLLRLVVYDNLPKEIFPLYFSITSEDIDKHILSFLIDLLCFEYGFLPKL